MYRLIFINGKRKGRRLVFRNSRSTIGSDPECTLSIGDAGLLAEHAAIERDEHGIHLRRLAPDAAVTINDGEVDHAALHDGDIIGLGSARLRFQAQQSLLQETGGRRADHLQRLTLAAVFILLLIELAILIAWSLYL